jgi:hypothetical protein
MSKIRNALYILGGIFFALLFIQNVSMLGRRLPFRFFHIETIDMLAGYWFIIFGGFGFMVGGFFSIRSYWYHQKTIRSLNAEIKHLNKELAQHRILSLEDEHPNGEPVTQAEGELAAQRDALLSDSEEPSSTPQTPEA